MSAMKFNEVIRSRRSSRKFLPDILQNAEIIEILQEAQLAPSNCNTQPWVVHIVSGEKRTRLASALTAEAKSGNRTADFPFNREAYQGIYQERNQKQAKLYSEALGVTRDDKEAREEAYLRNFDFFGAPHVAMLFMPAPYDVRVAGDIGMFAQSFLLSLTSRSLAGIPQTSLSYFASTVKEILNVPDDLKLLFGISFGYADEQYPAYGFDLGRAPLSENVVFHK
jgi:nitroreductase